MGAARAATPSKKNGFKKDIDLEPQIYTDKTDLKQLSNELKLQTFESLVSFLLLLFYPSYLSLSVAKLSPVYFPARFDRKEKSAKSSG
jgi:hypothetical protein